MQFHSAASTFLYLQGCFVGLKCPGNGPLHRLSIKLLGSEHGTAKLLEMEQYARQLVNYAVSSADRWLSLSKNGALANGV